MDAFQAIGDSFSPLKVRNLQVYFLGQTISTIGTWLQVTAYAWVVWQLTESTIGLGVSAMLYSLPFLIVGPFASAWADRVDRRILRISTQAFSMLIAFTLAVLALTNSLQVWQIYFFSAVMGIVSALDVPAAQAFLSDLAGVRQVRQATNLYLLITQISRILGPAIGAFILGGLGVGVAFFLNGLSFLALITCLLIVRVERIPKPASERGSFREAISYVRKEPRLADSIVCAMLVTFFGYSILMNMLPAVAALLLDGDASTYSLLMGVSGVGALIGIIVIAPLMQTRAHTGLMLTGVTLLGGAFLLLLGLTKLVSMALLALLVSGFALSAVMTTIMGILQVNAPQEMRARLIGLFLLVSYGFQPFAALWIGWAADAFGLQNAIILNAALLVIGTAALMRHAPLRAWRETHYAPTPEPNSVRG